MLWNRRDKINNLGVEAVTIELHFSPSISATPEQLAAQRVELDQLFIYRNLENALNVKSTLKQDGVF